MGFGTVDCFRARVEWVSRSFGGGASPGAHGNRERSDRGRWTRFRRHDLSCLRRRSFGDDLDYRFNADLTQPYLTPRNSITLSAYAERLSEPDVFQREAEGARVAVTHTLDPRQTVTVAADAERGRTLASPAVFCVAFQVCDPRDVAALTQERFTNSLGVSWFRNRTDFLVDPTRGHP